MKRTLRTLPLLILAILLMTVPAFADTGPKPYLRVRVMNAPQEEYYLDILAEGEPREQPKATKDPLEQQLRAAVPEGWHACVSQGTSGAPIFGDLTGEDAGDGSFLHDFRYLGVPSRYRIIVVTASGESWISEPMDRPALQSSVTVDWATKRVSAPPVWVAYSIQFLCTFLVTLAIELLVLKGFGYSLKQNWKPFLLVNLVTQGALTAWLSLTIVREGGHIYYIMLLLPAELLISLIEGTVYALTFTGGTKKRAFAYGVCANALSAIAGGIVSIPVWKLVTFIS